MRCTGAGGTVVETGGVPHPVVATAAAMEVHALCTVKAGDAVVHVARCMRVHHVNEHHHAQAVRLVNQGFQLVGRPTPAAHLRSAQPHSSKNPARVNLIPNNIQHVQNQ